MDRYYTDTKIMPESLESWELVVIPKLKKLLEITGEIYAKQISTDLPGGNYYPSDTTKEEVIKASVEDKELINPYTIVKRREDGSLFAVPYSVEYLDELNRIIEVIKEFIDDVKEPILKGYLENLISACKNNTWEELENYWLSNSGNKLDLQLAPIEPYMDSLLNIKHGFQGTLRYATTESKYAPNEYIEIAKAIRISTFENDPISEPGLKIRVRIDEILASSGQQAYQQAKGSNYPNDPDKVLEFGTKILIYSDFIEKGEKNTLIPLGRSVMQESTIDKYSVDTFIDASIRAVVVHEIAEAMIKHNGAKERLKDMYLPVREIHSSLMGMKMASIHVLQGALDHNIYEAMLLTRFIFRGFFAYKTFVDSKNTNRSIEHYLKGYAVVLNILQDRGGIVVSDGKLDVDFKTLFATIDELADLLDKMKAEKTEEEARAFFDEHCDYSFFDQFKF